MKESKIMWTNMLFAMNDYVDKYVICHECNRPDTRIIREGRIFLLKCAACGATAPLKTL